MGLEGYVAVCRTPGLGLGPGCDTNGIDSSSLKNKEWFPKIMKDKYIGTKGQQGPFQERIIFYRKIRIHPN